MRSRFSPEDPSLSTPYPVNDVHMSVPVSMFTFSEESKLLSTIEMKKDARVVPQVTHVLSEWERLRCAHCV